MTREGANLLRLMAFAIAAVALFLFGPAGRPQENSLRYARSQIDTLTEFTFDDLKFSAGLRLFPATVPQSPSGFTHNLKQRRVICFLPGEEPHVFEAIGTRTLDTLIADDVARVRTKLEQMNQLGNQRGRLDAEVAGKRQALAAKLAALRARPEGQPVEELREAYASLAAQALELMDLLRQAVKLSTESRRQSFSYRLLQTRLAILLNHATAEKELELLARRKPESLVKGLVATLAAESAQLERELAALGSRAGALRTREERALQEAFEFPQPADALTVLKLLRDRALQMVEKVYRHPARFAELIEVELELTEITSRQAEASVLLTELSTLGSAEFQQGLALLKAVEQQQVGEHAFDAPTLTQGQLGLLAAAADWELGAWKTFLQSLAASFGAPRGQAVSIPPAKEVFTGPNRLRLAPNEIPAFLSAVSQLSGDDVDRLAELLELTAQECQAAASSNEEESTFWEFANYYLQERVRSGLGSGN